MKQFLIFLGKFLLLTLGFFMISFYIWLRFIRVRIPRDIPFDFSQSIINILLFICFLYLVIIIITFYSHSKRLDIESKPYKIRWYHNLMKNIATSSYISYISLFLAYLFKPVILFETYIKEHPRIYPYYKSLLLKIVNIFPLYEEEMLFTFYKDMYFIMFLLARIILATVFFIDTFYFQRLHYIYIILPIGITVLLARYFLFSLKYFKEKQIVFLEYACCAIESKEWAERKGYKDGEAEEIHILYDCLLPRRFIEEQSFVLYLDGFCYKFDAGCEPAYMDECRKKYSDYSLSQTIERLNKIISEEVVPVAALLRHFEAYDEISSFTQKVKLAVYSVYFICFMYILIAMIFGGFCSIYIIL
jgi:hypothetical protein